jgi:hypothetical protein
VATDKTGPLLRGAVSLQYREMSEAKCFEKATIEVRVSRALARRTAMQLAPSGHRKEMRD